jgi:DNA-binding MarR family transcriptional regulator
MQGSRAEAELKEAALAADRLHSAAIHLLRWLRTRDLEAGVGPAQLSALSVLVFAGPKSLARLAEAEQVKPPTMSRIVDGLVRANLATTATDQRDRRGIVICASQQGIRTMKRTRRRRVETLAGAVRRLSTEEIAGLKKAAEIMESFCHKL